MLCLTSMEHAAILEETEKGSTANGTEGFTLFSGSRQRGDYLRSRGVTACNAANPLAPAHGAVSYTHLDVYKRQGERHVF